MRGRIKFQWPESSLRRVATIRHATKSNRQPTPIGGAMAGCFQFAQGGFYLGGRFVMLAGLESLLCFELCSRANMTAANLLERGRDG